jgi:hypothetical protein
MRTPGKAQFLRRALPLTVIGAALLSMAPGTITESSRLILSGAASADVLNIDDYSAVLNLPAKAGLLTSALTAAAGIVSVPADNAKAFICLR